MMNEVRKNKNAKTKKTKNPKTAEVELLVGVEIDSEPTKKWETKRGRPQKFDPDLAIQVMEEEIEDYIKNRKKEGRYWEALPTNENGGVAYRGKPFTTVGTIALMCGVDITTFLAHVNAKNEDGSIKNEQLFKSYMQFKDLGQLRLIEGGASGAYSPNYVSFVGNVNYGMIPKQQIEQSVEVKSMDKVYEELDKHHAAEAERIEKQKQAMIERKKRLDALDKESE